MNCFPGREEDSEGMEIGRCVDSLPYLGLMVLVVPGTAEAHHRGEDLLGLSAAGRCVHSRSGSSADDREIELQGDATAGSVDKVPNPDKMMAIWRLYWTRIDIDYPYILIRKIRDVTPSLTSLGGMYLELLSEFDVQRFQANRSRLLLTLEVRWYFDGRVVTHRRKVVEWIPRKAEDETQGCQQYPLEASA
jgi:hypothetical protein